MAADQVPVEDVNLFNAQLVGTNGETFTIMRPQSEMTRDEALVHAAYLVALADTADGRFDAIRKRVENT